MRGRAWTENDLETLKKIAPIKGCKMAAKALKRTVRSVQHKYNELGLEKVRAKVGDKIHGWRIDEIYLVHNGNQYVRWAKVTSIFNQELKTEFILTRLTNRQVAWANPKRPDMIGLNTTHGESKTRLYRIWYGMRNRCLNPKQLSYKDYGGRGIKICNEWMNFENFSEWAKENGYREELTLDRIDNNKNYCPENCKWSTVREQAANKRNTSPLVIAAFGEKKSIYEWIHDDRCPLTRVIALEYRIKAGWEPERAITQSSERQSRPSLRNWLEDKHPKILQEYYLE